MARFAHRLVVNLEASQIQLRRDEPILQGRRSVSDRWPIGLPPHLTMNTPRFDSPLEERREPRYNVAWRAYVELPGGTRAEAKVRDISESGIGLQTDFAVPAMSTVKLTLGVPDLHDPTRVLAVPGTLKVMFVVMQGHNFRLGGVWANLGPSAQQFLHQWVRKLRTGI